MGGGARKGCGEGGGHREGVSGGGGAEVCRRREWELYSLDRSRDTAIELSLVSLNGQIKLVKSCLAKNK